MGFKVGIDVGGTFTDLVYSGGENDIRVVKTPSTPHNQAEGVLKGIEKIATNERLSVKELLGTTDLIIHGTTVATNTMLEFDGAKTGLIATKGFRDDIELRRGYKERIFDPHYPAPTPIALRRHRLTVRGRIDREAKELAPLDEAEVVETARRLKDKGVESIAVCLLYSFLNSSHEKRVGEILAREFPEAFVSLSHEVLPQIREFERVSTTLVNAYTSPKLRKYLASLQSGLSENGFRGEFFVMLSNGGLMNAAYAGKYSVYSLLSGPAGGIVASTQLIGEQLDKPNLITIDMGGTSFDVSLIRDGKPTITTDYWFSRYRVAAPMLDIHTIGAGGGSIAWVDSGGVLQVGPESAGAEPGPVCYGKGGTRPTVTDANLVLGFLDPDYFLGGEMKLGLRAAKKAIEDEIAGPMGIETIEAAYGIFRIVNNSMATGIRAVSVQRGHDPRGFVLVAFGGNGALHAGILAQELGIKRVIVPRTATAFSARGMLSSNIVITKVKTYIGRSDDYDLAEINSLFGSMQNEVEGDLPEGMRKSSGFMKNLETHCYIDMHYRGELHEITVSLDTENGAIRSNHVSDAVERFHQAHEALHTFSNPDAPVLFMNLRLEAVVDTYKPAVNRRQLSGEVASNALRNKRKVFFDSDSGLTEVPIYEGLHLRPGNMVQGPCVIEEPATTIVVYPGQAARLSEYDNYEISIAGF